MALRRGTIGLLSILVCAGAFAGPPNPIAAVDDFCYQLQGKNGDPLDLAPIAASAFDLCIIDFSRDGSDEFTPAEIAALRSQAEPARLRLAYLSIGEAEKYRFYWDALDKSLLAGANPEWKGNYKVRYWEPAWHEIVIHGNGAIGASYLDRIIDQGFDGVYLDIVDAFEFFGPQQAGGENVKRDAAEAMIDFIDAIAVHARVTRGVSDFLIVPQNGANILDPEWYPVDTLGVGDPQTPEAMAAFQQARFFAIIDAIGAEDSFFFGKKANDNKVKPQQYTLGFLDIFRAAGKPVLATEYLTKAKKITKLYDEFAPDHDFVPYATVRNLGKLSIAPAFPPD
jgi:cysteinyl-tRNA synthetase, unknown class